MENQSQIQSIPLDSLPYNDLDRLAQVLYFSFNGENAEVQEATHILNTMAMDILRFIDSLMKLVSIDKPESNFSFCLQGYNSLIVVNFENVKNSACMLATTSLKITIKRAVLGPQEKEAILNCILQALYSPNLAVGLKVNLQSSLEELFKTDSGK